MAKIFYARSGSDPSRSKSIQEISIKQTVEYFSKFEHKYSTEPPYINKEENPSPYSAFTHVVIEIKKEEINEKFNKPGFYWLPELSPSDCSGILGSQ